MESKKGHKWTAEEQMDLYQTSLEYNQDLLLFGTECMNNPFLVPEVHGEIADWLNGPRWCPNCRTELPWQVVDPPEILKDRLGVPLPIECPWCHALIMRFKRFRLILIPRDCLKTTFVTTYGVLHKLVRDPNRRILIGSENHELSKTILGAIKSIIDFDEVFRQYYGDLNGKKLGYKWSGEAITIATRTSWEAKEHNIETCGIDVTITGRHYRDIIIDDPHSQKNVTTVEQITQVIEWIKLLMPMLEEGGTFTIVGTRWHDADAYNWALEQKDEKTGEPLFTTFIKSAYLDDGSAYYPIRNSLPALEDKRSMMGQYLFSCQYLNDPIPKGSSLFDTEQIKLVEATAIPRDLFKVMIVDPASLEVKNFMSADRDETAMGIFGISPEKDFLGIQDIYLLDAMSGDWDLDKAFDVLIAMYMRNRPYVVGIERQGMSMFAGQVLSRIEQKGSYMKIHELLPANRSKEARITSFSPTVNTGHFHILENLSDGLKLIQQLMRFPRGKLKDLADLCGYLEDIKEEFKAAIGQSTDNEFKDKIRQHLNKYSRPVGVRPRS